MDLWSNSDRAAWASALERYPRVLQEHGKERLPELDSWYRETLPGVIVARHPPHLTVDELARVAEWKMKRGSWRPRNLGLVKGNPPDDVVRASAEAIVAASVPAPDPRKPVARLAELAGVGPATASAVLACVRPDVYPFFDEDVAGIVPKLGEVKFTMPYYLRYAERLRARAAELGGGWTAHAVGHALWVAAQENP